MKSCWRKRLSQHIIKFFDVENEQLDRIENKLDHIGKNTEPTTTESLLGNPAGYPLDELTVYLLVESAKICTMNDGDFTFELNKHDRLDSWDCKS